MQWLRLCAYGVGLTSDEEKRRDIQRHGHYRKTIWRDRAHGFILAWRRYQNVPDERSSLCGASAWWGITRYPKLNHKHVCSDEDEGYIAVIHDLPGSSAWGETQSDALQAINNAVQASLKAKSKKHATTTRRFNMSKKIIRLSAVQIKVGVSRRTIYRWEKDPNSGFPKRVILGANSVGFFEHEIEEWLNSRHRANL